MQALFRQTFVGIALVAATTAFGQSGNAISSHCLHDEFIVLSAEMGRVIRAPDGNRLKKDGKILSVCADKPSEPFGKLVYRYGRPGHIELEEIASATRKFNVSSRSSTPHSGEEILFFSKRGVRYYVASATGQGNGISLLVFQSGKLVANLFSGTQQGKDFQIGPAYIDYDITRSPVLAKKDLTDSF